MPFKAAGRVLDRRRDGRFLPKESDNRLPFRAFDAAAREQPEDSRTRHGCPFLPPTQRVKREREFTSNPTSESLRDTGWPGDKLSKI